MRIAALPSTVRLQLGEHQHAALQPALDAAREYLKVATAAGDTREIEEARAAVASAEAALEERYPVFVAKPLTPAEIRRIQAEIYVAQAEERRALQPRPVVTGPDSKEIPQPAPAPLTHEEKVALAEAESVIYMRTFAERVVDIEDLDIDGERYDHTNAAHRDAIELGWQMEIGLRLIAGARLDTVTRGKSSSPSA